MVSDLLRNAIAGFLGNKIETIQGTGSTDTVAVASTCLSDVAYDILTSTLTVTFLESGASYEYYGVPESDFEALVTTFGSVGETYNDIIKGTYLYSRV